MTVLEKSSFAESRNLHIPLAFKEKGYLWEVLDEDTGKLTHKNELWFYGEF